MTARNTAETSVNTASTTSKTTLALLLFSMALERALMIRLQLAKWMLRGCQMP
jgi:hypothetical protein